jgi:hypothetical protein
MAVTEALAPADVHAVALSKLQDMQGQIADLDQQLAANSQKRQQLDATMAAALDTVSQARAKMGAASSHLTRAKAAALIDAASAAPRLAAAEAEVAEAQTALAAAQETAQTAGSKRVSQSKSLEGSRSGLVAQRRQLADLAEALEAHAQEAHHDAGMHALAELSDQKEQLLERIRSAQDELASARSALDELHTNAVPALLAEHSDLAATAKASGVASSEPHAALAIIDSYLDFLSALERHAAPRKASNRAPLLQPSVFIRGNGDTFRLVLQAAILGDLGALSSLRKPAEELRERVAEQATAQAIQNATIADASHERFVEVQHSAQTAAAWKAAHTIDLRPDGR